jgi:hypothetical protein
VIQNQCLFIPPDHPLAVELYDLIGLQGVLMSQQNDEAALVNAGGDRASYDRHDVAIGLVDKEIEALQKKYRVERGGDETCRVGLTYDARGFPVVNGRPGGPLVH